MKTLKKIGAAMLLCSFGLGSFSSHATLSFSNVGGNNYSASVSSLSQGIPDNNPSGVGYSINFGATGLNVSDISVSFSTSGGYNGDIYAYLSHGSTIAVLLNQITGTAASGSGFNVTLVEGTANPIQTASGTAGAVLSGTAFTANNNLANFNGSDPNGNWTLFFADLNPGDTSTLTGFSLNITAVPEPVTMALPIFGGVLVTAGVVRRLFFPRAMSKT